MTPELAEAITLTEGDGPHALSDAMLQINDEIDRDSRDALACGLDEDTVARLQVDAFAALAERTRLGLEDGWGLEDTHLMQTFAYEYLQEFEPLRLLACEDHARNRMVKVQVGIALVTVGLTVFFLSR